MSDEEKIVQEEFYVAPIASPLVGEKLKSRILRLVRKQIQVKQLKRGVKEVTKAIRKQTKGICIFAADVSPVDVISHLPVFCEENGIPYCFVRSRMELGAAAQTKKPTSVVLILKPAKEDKAGQDKFTELFDKISAVNPYI